MTSVVARGYTIGMSIVLAERMGTLSESATLALNARAKELAAAGKIIYNLTAGELATDTPEYIQRAVAERLQHNKYTPVAGLPELRERIAAEARAFYGLNWIEAANVVVTAGAKPALFASLQVLLNPGDEVIVPVPAWSTSYRPLIELAGGKMVEVPLTAGYDLDPAAIAVQLSAKTKAIIINSPHNPTGSVFSAAALRKVAQVLKNKAVTVIADDIYSKLVYQDDFTLAASCDFEQLIIINGFSKSQALTGWRVGYLIADSHVAHGATSLLSHVTGNAAVPSQYAALAALKLHDLPPQTTIATLKRQRQMVVEALSDIPGLKYNIPGGAFYVFLDLRDFTEDSADWCERLLGEAGVALVPGDAFSAPGFARLTFVTDETTLLAALKQIRKFVTHGGKL